MPAKHAMLRTLPITTEPFDPLLIALEHNAWATRELLRACAALDDAAWHRRFDIGPGSLHDTLTHVVGAMFVHVTTHGMHHRAQCVNMLRQLAAPGISDRLPEVDVLDWAAPRG